MNESAPMSDSLLRELFNTLTARLARIDDQLATACSFIYVVCTHPNPPDDGLRVTEALRQAVQGDEPANVIARALRSASRELNLPTVAHALASACPIVFLELALDLDDKPAERIALIQAYATLWGPALNFASVQLPMLLSGEPGLVGQASLRTRRSRAIEPHVKALCAAAAECVIGQVEGAELSHRDRIACLNGIRLAYGGLGITLGGEAVKADELARDFERNGSQVWDGLTSTLIAVGSKIGSESAAEWSHRAKRQLRLALALADRSTSTSSRSQSESNASTRAPKPTTDDKLTLTVCRSPIQPSSDRHDQDEIERHRVLEQPLPVRAIPVDADRKLTSKAG